MKNKYSVTSNRVKMLKHMNKLQRIQDRFTTDPDTAISPIMVHIIQTHRCNLNCVHCCFRNRKDKRADMPWNVFEEGTKQFLKLGVKAFEFTGGGEPTMYPLLNQSLTCLTRNKASVGLITNGTNIKDRGNNPIRFELCKWVRVSLNTLDYREDMKIEPILEKSEVSFCYIWNPKSHYHIDRIGKFADKYEIVCRVAPDCIQKPHKIKKDMEKIRKYIKPYDYLFLSDFNIDLKRPNNNCMMQMVKPCFYLDGYVYACPSTELAIENNKQARPDFRVCKYDKIADYYIRDVSPLEHDCSYCKYVQQNSLLEDLIVDTEDNEFA